jgi:hypothetical protein
MIHKYFINKSINRFFKFISKKLESTMITSFKYDEVGDFHNGMAKVRNGEKWGYINKSGVEVIAFRYEAAGDFHNGRAYVKSKGKYGFIDKYDSQIPVT